VLDRRPASTKIHSHCLLLLVEIVFSNLAATSICCARSSTASTLHLLALTRARRSSSVHGRLPCAFLSTRPRWCRAWPPSGLWHRLHLLRPGALALTAEGKRTSVRVRARPSWCIGLGPPSACCGYFQGRACPSAPPEPRA
jgi:hypothetical protein